MRKLAIIGVAALLLTGMFMGVAMAAGHYVNGVEGIKGASVPPPGFYWKNYDVLYNADTLVDDDGDELKVDFDVTVFAFVNRFIWVTPYQLFGGDFFMDFTIPLIYTDIKIGAFGISDDQFGLGDINVEPVGISWHGQQWDAAFGLSFYAPTGEYKATDPASPGKDYWTGMLTLGGTVYFDAEKTWSASILGRYEIHSERGDDDYKPGYDFHFEWGVGKTLAKVWDVGLAGYCQWQITDDSGTGNPALEDIHDRVYAIGPEVSLFIPKAKLFIDLRSLWEFLGEDTTEGNVTTLTLTKIF